MSKEIPPTKDQEGGPVDRAVGPGSESLCLGEPGVREPATFKLQDQYSAVAAVQAVQRVGRAAISNVSYAFGDFEFGEST